MTFEGREIQEARVEIALMHSGGDREFKTALLSLLLEQNALLRQIAENTRPRTIVMEPLDREQLKQFSQQWMAAGEASMRSPAPAAVQEEVELCGERVPYERSNVFCVLPKQHAGPCMGPAQPPSSEAS